MKTEIELIQTWGNDLMVVNAARVSMGKRKTELDEKDIKLIKYLAEHKHVSCFEHCGMTFYLKIPIYVARQLMRHRSWAFNEISGRYVEFEEEFFMPPHFREQDENVKQGSKEENSLDFDINQPEIEETYLRSMENSFAMYKQLLSEGVCKEQARGVLPLSLYTQMYATCNLRSFVHFLDLRLDKHAQKEIRDVAVKMLELVKETDAFKYSMGAYGVS